MNMLGRLAGMLAAGILVAAQVCGCSSSNATANTADGNAPDAADVPSQVVVDGFVSVPGGPWVGYGFTVTEMGTIVPDCSNGCTPPYVGPDFCMHGTLTANTAAFGMLGWNVNQAAGTTGMLTWPVPATGGITVTVSNPLMSNLRLQLQGTDPHSPTDRWCAPLVSGQQIPWSSFVTNCYPGGSPQDALTAGTMIQQAAIIVPGTTVPMSFDVCLVNVDIQP